MLLLSVAFFAAIAGQQPPPVFRAEAYVVTNHLRLLEHGDTPIRGLTTDDFVVTIEHAAAAIIVEEQPQQPGNYVLSLNPPDAVRDGKTHKIEVKVRIDGKWRTLPMKWKATFEKPRQTG